MIDQCEKSVSLRNSFFDEENPKRKIWKLFACTCNRSRLVFCAMVRILLSTTCEETTDWIATLSSTVGYIPPSSKL